MNYIYKCLWPEMKPYRGKIILALVVGSCISGLKSTLPALTKFLTETWSAPDPDPRLIVLVPVAIAVAWIFASAGRFFQLFWVKYIAAQVSIKMRRDLMEKYLSLNLGFFQRFVSGSGGLISRMVNDIQMIESGVQKIADLLREPIMAVFVFGYLIYLDWQLTLLLLTGLPVVAILVKLAKSIRKYSRRDQENMEELTKTLKESLDGTRIVQAFNLEQEMKRRFDVRADQILQNRKKIISREEAAGPISESVVMITQSLLLIYVGFRVANGEFTLPDFFAFLVAVGMLQDAVKKIQAGYVKLQQASVALERMNFILGSTSIVPQLESPKNFPKNWKEIEFRNVSFSFEPTEDSEGNARPRESILNKVNLTVARGEMIAIVGASGGGKSTLVNLLARFFDPTEGQILIGGIPITEIGLRELRSEIALVSQDVFLFSDSIAHNIHLGAPEKNAEGIQTAAKIANAHEFIMRTDNGYQTIVGDRGGRLSGGEKQRISIARAIFKDAPILILDEATSALDSESEREVQKGLDQLMKGRTSFVIAHRLSTITQADRIIVVKDGQIIEQGSHKELLDQQGEYFRFHQLQASL